MASLELYGFEELADAYLRILDIPWPVMEQSLDEMAETGLRAIKSQGEAMGVRDPEGRACGVIGVTKAIRRAIGKTFGDEIDVVITAR